MNKTTNYQLPQWEASDPIRRGDFNAAFASLDAGIAAAQAAAEGAQETADTARTEAAVLPYAVGSYKGTGEVLNITLGFRPSFIIVAQNQAFINESSCAGCICISGPSVTSGRVIPTDTGFQLAAPNSSVPYPKVNTANTTYCYIAFR